MIDPTTIQRVKDANDIVDTIQERLTLRKTGSNYIGICPFHDDKTPSLTVNKAKQLCKCFACGWSGDVINFVQQFENITFPEAVKMLGQKVGIEIEDQEMTPEEIRKSKERESLQIAIEAATSFYEKNIILVKGELSRRGYQLTDKVIKDFRIGYAQPGNKLLEKLQSAGFSTEILQKIDVIKQGDRGHYDTFRDRIQFPFMDLNGHVTGFSGRIVTPCEKVGKYLNTGDTPLFQKGHSLFGLYQAKAEIGRKENVYLVEGQFDVTSFHREGIRNTIAGSGTALTSDQVRLISRFTRVVTLIYDADKAGMTASIRNCEALLQAGLTVRCISLPAGKDPDNMANEMHDKLDAWLVDHTLDFIAYFFSLLIDPKDPEKMTEAFKIIEKMISMIPDNIRRSEYIKRLCSLFKLEDQTQHIASEIKDLRSENPEFRKPGKMLPGIYGIEELKENLKSGFDEYDPVFATSDFDLFLSSYQDNLYIYIHKKAELSSIQNLRSIVSTLFVHEKEIGQLVNTKESEFMASLVDMFKAGLTDIRILRDITSDDDNKDQDSEEEQPFLNYYFDYYSQLSSSDEINKPLFVDRCATLLSYASDSERLVNISNFAKLLSMPKASFESLVKPLLERRKSKLRIESQRDDKALEMIDGTDLPEYVTQNKDYQKMYNEYGYFPYLNKQCEPVAYVFKTTNGHVLVGDFYMEPLLHIYHPRDPEQNRRIFKIYRRFFPKPFFMEFKSSALQMRSTFEAVIINEEAMNFDNGTNEFWVKIKSCMSRHYTIVTEQKIYGQQPEDFFAFSNAIFHKVDGRFQIELTTDLGVTTHNEKNYYHPSSSIINRNINADDDPYENIRQLKFESLRISGSEELIPVRSGDENESWRRKRFAQWASLMDRVYIINDNGKWSILYAIMCAFRSDIHSIDRFFTALFFMGPTSSGKTQLGISIRSLYISPKQPALNLNTATDAAMASLMGNFRDVPVVLEEYNNKDISDNKFQALKAITYDGDSKQKRKGTSGRDIEMDKIFAPVIITGQETPQRDDNALMNRIIVCEVPKKGLFSEEAKAIFQELKQMQDEGLSDILFEVLQLRPIIRQYFKPIWRSLSKELSDAVLIGSNASGDMVRIINTVSMFLTLCKILEEHAPQLKLPFTYDEFFLLAKEKVVSQVEMITHTDKLATFFKGMDVMIDTSIVKRGRDFDIEMPTQVTFKMPGGEKEVKNYGAQKQILFIRISNVFTCYAHNYNSENVTQSTLEQNLRSHPAYLGVVDAHRFKWLESTEVPANTEKQLDGEEVTIHDMSMRKVMQPKSTVTSCMAIDYEIFRRFYEDIDFDREQKEQKTTADPYQVEVPF